MISVIICSVNPALLNDVSENIKATIGVPYELVVTDNRGSDKGMCQVYNESVPKAKYEILCFIHEDIIIQSNNWGSVLVKNFKDPQLGLIGVAGSSYRPLTPSAWGGIGHATAYKNIIQSFKYKDKPEALYYLNPRNEKLSKVVCVDGVWLSTTKTIASEIKFDENTFKGFHFYDLDFSLAVAQKYNVAVTYEILIKHLSEGRYNRAWMEDNLKFSDKWHDQLPLAVENLSMDARIRGEKNSFKNFIDELIKFGFPMSTAYKVLWRNGKFFQTYRKLFFKMNYYILKKYASSPAAARN